MYENEYEDKEVIDDLRQVVSSLAEVLMRLECKCKKNPSPGLVVIRGVDFSHRRRAADEGFRHTEELPHIMD